jgi:superfamily II DNA or RNA helicase
MYWEIRQFLIKNQINVEVVITPTLSNILNIGLSVELHDKFNFELRDYQREVITKALQIGRGTCVLGTGAGKTFTTAALIENYFINSQDRDTFKCIMVVPDLGLVEQTYEEFMNCGTTFKLTRWTGKRNPDLTANVIICNIGILQSRINQSDWVNYVDLLIVDECHKVNFQNKISKIISNIKTHNRYGFTGTLPVDDLSKWAVIGMLGPVIYEKSSYELRLEDYLANVKIKALKLNYSEQIIYERGKNNYRTELDFIYHHNDRNNLLKRLCNKLTNNTLILVNHIAHGEALLECMQDMKSKQVYFIRGEVDVEDREKIKRIMERDNNVICIAISAIFSTGVNVKNLHNIVFAAGGKSFIRTVQSIGRGLRKHSLKEKLFIFDICDNLRYGMKHFKERIDIYNKEKIQYSVVDIDILS